MGEMARKQRLMRWDKSKRKYVRSTVGELECLMVMVWLELTTTIPKNEEMLLKVVAGVVLAVRGLPLDLKRVVRVVREEMEEERTVLMMLIQLVSDPSRRLESLGRKKLKLCPRMVVGQMIKRRKRREKGSNMILLMVVRVIKAKKDSVEYIIKVVERIRKEEGLE